MISAQSKIDNGKERSKASGDKHILIALDRTENAERAVLYVADFLGGQEGVCATLLSIVAEPSEDYFQSDFERANWLENQYSTTREILENYREILIHSGFSESKIDVRIIINYCTSIAECIIEEQKNLDCCTIVVSRRIISRQEEFLMGSTSSKILHTPKNCAIWVVE